MIGPLFRTEMRMLLRDTRTVLIAVVAPVVIFPLGILGFQWVQAQEETRMEDQAYRVAVAGERRAWAEAMVDAALALESTERPGATRPRCAR